MNLKQFQAENKTVLPPNLDAGMDFSRIERIQSADFNLDGQVVKAIRVFTDKGEYKTSSTVIMDILSKYFEKNTEPLTNVKVVIPRGKRYLTLEGY